jgi:hypothetical protein
MRGEREIRIPVLLVLPARSSNQKMALTVIFAQAGKERLINERADAIAGLLQNGVGVCLPDLRGVGETEPGSGRSRQSGATSISATELMLGQTLLGSRLKDLRSLLVYLRARTEFDSNRIAIWGDSLAPVNPSNRNLSVPHGIDDAPDQGEPGGPLLAIFAGLYDDNLAAAVSARGGLVGWQSVLESEFLYLPHDAVIPAALTVCDLDGVVEALFPKPVFISGLVDGRNREVTQDRVERFYASAMNRYALEETMPKLELFAKAQDPANVIAPWLVRVLEP